MKFIFITTLILGLNTYAATGDANAGKAKAATCIACHGEAGVSANDLWPNLAGQKEGYLKEQLALFQKGERQNPLMTPVAKMLSEKDIEDLAAFFAGMKR